MTNEDDETVFLCWYQDLRQYGREDGEREYKHTLGLARVWETRYWAAVGHLATDDVCHDLGKAHACECPCHRPPPQGRRLLISRPTVATGGAHSLEWVESP